MMHQNSQDWQSKKTKQITEIQLQEWPGSRRNENTIPAIPEEDNNKINQSEEITNKTSNNIKTKTITENHQREIPAEIKNNKIMPR